MRLMTETIPEFIATVKNPDINVNMFQLQNSSMTNAAEKNAMFKYDFIPIIPSANVCCLVSLNSSDLNAIVNNTFNNIYVILNAIPEPTTSRFRA